MQLCSSEPLFIWAASWQNQQNDLCAQWRLDQPGHPPSLISLCYPHEETLDPHLPMIWVVTGLTSHLVGFVVRWLNCSFLSSDAMGKLGCTSCVSSLAWKSLHLDNVQRKFTHSSHISTLSLELRRVMVPVRHNNVPMLAENTYLV